MFIVPYIYIKIALKTRFSAVRYTYKLSLTFTLLLDHSLVIRRNLKHSGSHVQSSLKILSVQTFTTCRWYFVDSLLSHVFKNIMPLSNPLIPGYDSYYVVITTLYWDIKSNPSLTPIIRGSHFLRGLLATHYSTTVVSNKLMQSLE